MVAGGEQSGYGILTVREQLWMFSQFYGLGNREGWTPGRRADRGGRAPRPAPAARQHAVDRPAPEDEHGPRPAQRPVDPVPRRADARPRRRRGRARSASSCSSGRPRSPAGRSCSRPTTWPRPTSCASGSRSSTTAGSSRSARPTSSSGASSASRSSGSSSTGSTAASARSRGCPGVVSAAPAADADAGDRSGSRSTSSSSRTGRWAASSRALGRHGQPHPRPAQVGADARGRLRRARRPRVRRRGAVTGRRPADRRRRAGLPAADAERGRGGRGRPRWRPAGERASRAPLDLRQHARRHRPADGRRSGRAARSSRTTPRSLVGRAYPRVRGMVREPSWVFFEILLPFLDDLGVRASSTARCRRPRQYIGFVVLGGAMTAFWLNVIWMMAAQLYWEKEPGQPRALLRRAR